MLRTLKRLLTGRTNRPGTSLPPRVAGLLEKDFAHLDKLKRNISNRLLSFVTTGEDAGVILELRGLPAPTAKTSRALGRLLPYGGGDNDPRASFFWSMPIDDGDVLCRLTQVYEADAAFRGHNFSRLDSDLGWLEVFLLLGTECCTVTYGRLQETRKSPAWTADHFEHMLEAAEASPDALVESLFGLDLRRDWIWNRVVDVGMPTIDGIGNHLGRQGSAVASILRSGNAAQRVLCLNSLSEVRTPLNGGLFDEVVSLAIGSAKTVREAAEVLLRKNSPIHDVVSTAFREKARSGSATARLHAAGALSRIEGESCRGFLEERLKQEKAPRVRAELEKLLTIHSEPDGNPEDDPYIDDLEAPTPRHFESNYSFPERHEDIFRRAIQRFNEKARDDHRKWYDRTEPRWRHGAPREIDDPVTARSIAGVWSALEEPIAGKKRKLRLLSQRRRHAYFNDRALARELGEFIQQTRLEPVPMIRLAFFCGLITVDKKNPYRSNYIDDDAVEWLGAYIQNHDPSLTLLDLAAAFSAAGLPHGPIDRLYLDWGWRPRSNPLGLTDDAIWPYFLSRLNIINQALGLAESNPSISSYYLDGWRTSAFTVLATFPRPPRAIAPHLWDLALGSNKTFRPAAQWCLRNYPDRHQLVIRALGSGRKDERATAATWLGDMGDPAAVKPLLKALKKEKHDEPKAAMMGSLETLGQDVDKFLNRKKLLEEAQKGLEKPIHKDLAWFPFDNLPKVTWERNRQKVAPEILRWFIVQSFRLKKPEPGPLLRRYCALMRPDQRHELGRFVLQAWLAHDTRPAHTHQEAEALADCALAQMQKYAKQYPQYYGDLDQAAYRKQQLGHFLNECLGSANSSKGVLAVAGACCGPEIVPAIQRYLKQYYGKRLAQGKALIQMLSWVDHPLAIQLLLSVGTRFRTRGIQKEAARYVDLLAERKGWSRDELGDRTIPNAGFESDGTQELDYGPRQFKAVLADDFSIQLTNPVGKAIKALPTPGKLDDEEVAKATKKGFTAAKRELKQVLKLQRERLYEAMCVRRSWAFDEWRTFLLEHPIVGRYCQRLVWMVQRNQEVIATFRPLADRTLTGTEDEELTCDAGDQVLLAHEAVLDPAVAKAWLEHLTDYEIEPLFEQFGKPEFTTTDELKQSTEIDAFEGHLVNSFKLRSRANKLGYQRGQAEDGGWFMTYFKPFHGLSIQAVIEFTGNIVPEENRTVALMRLYFSHMKDDSSDDSVYFHRPVKLGRLPSILVAESWNDLRQMAADGSGFDPDWQKKTEW